MTNSRNISPTAHYTGYVWVKNQLSHPAFATLKGQLLYHSFRMPHLLSRRLGGPSFDDFLLARHTLIDHLLSEAIEQGRVTQVVEIASGLSPRGWRFSERYGKKITYIEADLPEMAKVKQYLLEQGGLNHRHHHVVALDALRTDGPNSLKQLFNELHNHDGTAIISEGLLNYFDTQAVRQLWRNIAQVLSAQKRSLYLSDIHLGNMRQDLITQFFMLTLQQFVRQPVHLHFNHELEATAALKQAGFSRAEIMKPSHFRDQLVYCRQPAADRVRIIRAQSGD